jgi:hypothetical protein
MGGGNSIAAAEMPVVRRCVQPPAGGSFLFGPRGTGTSTWLAQSFPGALHDMPHDQMM